MATATATASASESSITPRAELIASLEKHNATFTTLLSLIPAQYYIQQTQEEADSKWLKNKKRKTGEEIKENKRKNLQAKLDPENQKTTAEIMFASDPSFANVSDEDEREGNGGPSKRSKTTTTSNSASSSNLMLPPSSVPAPLPPTTSISDLRKRLAGKLASFRTKRGAATGSNGIQVGSRNGNGADADGGDNDDDDEGGSGGESDNTTSRDALEAESRRRRGEIRDKRRRERKEARRLEREKGGAGQQSQQKGGGGVKGKEGLGKKEERNVPTAKTQLIVPQYPTADSLTLPKIALPSSSSKYRVGTGSEAGPAEASSSTNGGTTFKQLSNPSHALANLQKHDKHLAALSDEKRAEIMESERWAKALHRAEGGKVVDSEKTLKKAVKRVEKGKSKSGKEWADRKRELSDAQAAAIKKRNDNIASRHQARKDKKMGIKKKEVKKVGGPGARKGGSGRGGKGDGGGGGGGDKRKGKGRPGFEGKKGKSGGK